MLGGGGRRRSTLQSVVASAAFLQPSRVLSRFEPSERERQSEASDDPSHSYLRVSPTECIGAFFLRKRAL